MRSASPRLPPPARVALRVTTAADLDAVFAMQSDPEANALAGTRPRDRAAFDARWSQILADPAGAGVIPRVIVADGALVGAINLVDDAIGYWLDRAHWGRGIATRAIAHMLAELGPRPLVAQVVEGNVGSLIALQRNGFVVTARAWREASDRHDAGAVISLARPPMSVVA